MTIATTLAKLKTRLEGISTPKPLAKVYDNPREPVDVGSFPVVVLSLDPQGQHRWSQATTGASGLARHDYQVAIWLFVGARNRPISELHAECMLWPEPIMAALFAGLTLDNSVTFIGSGDGTLYTYTIGVIEWQGKDLFGLTLSLGVTEMIPTPMDA